MRKAAKRVKRAVRKLKLLKSISKNRKRLGHVAKCLGTAAEKRL